MSGLVLCTVNQPAISGACGELWLTRSEEKLPVIENTARENVGGKKISMEGHSTAIKITTV